MLVVSDVSFRLAFHWRSLVKILAVVLQAFACLLLVWALSFSEREFLCPLILEEGL